MRESVVEKHLRKQVIAKGGLIRKMIWPGHRGAPDRLVIWPHHNYNRISTFADVDFVELKAPGKKPDPHQEREHAKLRAAGCSVFTLDSIEAVDHYIAERTS